MSELFMDMQRKRGQSLHHHHNHHGQAADSCSNSFSAYSDHHHHENNANVNDDDDVDDANEAEHEISNILSLKLKKPKHWKWELTASRTCMNIALPRILLYDHTGQLLVDVNTQEDEQVYKDPTNNNKNKTNQPSRSRKRSVSRSVTSNLEHSIRQALNQEFDGLQIEEATPTTSLQSPATSTTPQHTRNSSPIASSSCIDFYTNDLPDYKIERRSSSLRGVRFKDDDTKSSANSFSINGLPTPPPSSGTTPTTGTSSSSGPREKRRYRRASSSGPSPVNSPSILERFSFNRGRFSSPEYGEEQEVYRPPRYFLRTSKAGTLVVKEESFSRCRRRPTRSKISSSENLPNENLSRQFSTNSFNMPSKSKDLAVPQRPTSPAGSLQNVTQVRRRKKLLPIRRFRSDGNVLLHANNLSSDEEKEDEYAKSESGLQRPRYRYDNLKRHLKEELVTLEPDNGVFHTFGSPTER